MTALFIFVIGIGELGAPCRLTSQCAEGLICGSTQVCTAIKWHAPDPEPPAWLDGDPVPPGFHVKRSARAAMAISGGVLLGLFLVTDGAVSRAFCQQCNGGVAALFDGLLQALGAGLILGGLLAHHAVLVYDGPGGLEAAVLPLPVAGGLTLTALATF